MVQWQQGIELNQVAVIVAVVCSLEFQREVWRALVQLNILLYQFDGRKKVCRIII